MEASRDLRSHVTDVVTCPICLELFNSPKSLPCLHTFCLKCIEGHCRDNEPGDGVFCPVCRQKFNIPEIGVAGLVSNFFIAGLVEARKTASDVAVQVPCEVCLLECDNDDSNVAVSTMYCVDCNQKLCEQCSRPHRRMKGGPHKVVAIGTEVETELIQTRGGKCDKHKDECLKLFCFDDMVNICLMCFAEEHHHHKCKDINAVAAECVKQIDADIETILIGANRGRDAKSRLNVEKHKFVACAESVECKLVERGEVLKKSVDAQVKELVLEGQSLKTAKCKEIENIINIVDEKLLAFETFSAYCRELKLKGKPCDITRAANDLHTRASALLQDEVTLDDYAAPFVVFTPMNIDELLDVGQNLIGTVKLDSTIDSSQTPSCISFVTHMEKTLEQQLAHSAETERCLRQQLEVCHSRLGDKNENKLEAQVVELKSKLETSENYLKISDGKCKLFEVNEKDMKAELENSVKAIKKLRKSENDAMFKLQKWEHEVKRLNGEVEQLSKSRNNLKEELKATQLTDSERQMREHLQTVPRVVHTLPGTEEVRGLTSLDGELYVLRHKRKEQVEMYNLTTTATTTTLHSLLRQQSLPGVKYWSLWDMTSCKQNGCLYIVDWTSGLVHKVESSGVFTKLSVNSKPWSLSVTSQFTVLVTCCGDRKLVELTTEGKQLREIHLQPAILNPWHAILLSDGQIVVCHGNSDDHAHRVCIVDSDGHVTHSYGGPPGSATVGQLNVPSHMAVDKNGFIFVADSYNSRVLLLSPTLNFVREIVSRDQFKWQPWRLFLDVDRRCLYVADSVTGRQGRVLVVQL